MHKSRGGIQLKKALSLLIALIVLASLSKPAYSIIENIYGESHGGSWNNNPENAAGKPDGEYAVDQLKFQTDIYTYGFSLPFRGTITQANLSIRWYAGEQAPANNPDELRLKYSNNSGTTWYNLDGTAYTGSDAITSYPLSAVNQSYALATADLPRSANTLYLGVHGYQSGGEDNIDIYIDSIWLSINYSTAPTAFTASRNSTPVQNYSVYFNATWEDDEGLSHYIFSVNQNSTWWNSTPIAFTAGRNESNYTMFISASKGTIVNWTFFANDTHGAWNSTLMQEFTVANAELLMKNATAPADFSPVIAGREWLICNFSLYDHDDDLNAFEARFYRHDKSYSDENNNSDHYSNTSCTIISQEDKLINYTCGFNVWYYALPGIWHCNGTASDPDSSSWNSSTINVSELYAFNTTPITLDFGQLNRSNVSANDNLTIIENLGNVPLGISLFGYGHTEGDGLCMNCTKNKNITVNHTRYSFAQGTSFEDMIPLSKNPVVLGSFSLKPRNPAFPGQESIYWKLKIPDDLEDVNCSGTIIVDLVRG